MAILFFKALPLLLLLSLTDLFASTLSLGIGINYGQIANNLPTPSRVSFLLRSLNVTRVKLYDADPNVLTAFANTNVEFVIGLGNEYLQRMSDPQQAQAWIQQHVQPYHTQTRITCITVGNEVLTGTDTQLKSYLLPAMQGVYRALVNLGLSNEIYVAHPHSAGILGNSFPPSSGSFRQDLSEYIHGMLNFHVQTKSPFLINFYPFFAYKDNPNEVPLDYVLFQPNQGTTDPITNLKYDNMLSKMAKSAAFSNATSLSSIPILLIVVSVTVLLYASTVAGGGDSSAFVKKTISSHSIVIFSKSYCPYCKKAKAVFRELNQKPHVVELDERDDGWNIQDAISEIVGRRTVPQVFINGKHIGGSDDTIEAYENGDLAKLLGVNSKNDDL